jgi:purine-binding chemotaxis protein CheW
MSNDLVVAAPAAGSSTAGSPAKQFLTFRIGGEEYGMDILKVQEIRSYEAPTRVAGRSAQTPGNCATAGAERLGRWRA